MIGTFWCSGFDVSNTRYIEPAQAGAEVSKHMIWEQSLPIEMLTNLQRSEPQPQQNKQLKTTHKQRTTNKSPQSQHTTSLIDRRTPWATSATNCHNQGTRDSMKNILYLVLLENCGRI